MNLDASVLFSPSLHRPENQYVTEPAASFVRDVVRSIGVHQVDLVLDDIEAFARSKPDALAIAEDGMHFSYARMWAITDRLAADILERVGRSGGSVAWIGGGGVARLLGYIAIQKAGQVFSAPPLSITDDQIKALLAVSEHDLILVEQGYEDTARQLTDGPCLLADVETPASTDFARPAVDAATGSHISVTSGSTGQPKAMRRSRAQMEFLIRIACQMQSLGPNDRTALLGQLWNPTQFTGLSVGAETHCFDVPRLGAGALSEWMERNAITTVMLYPAIFREIVAARRPLPDLRCIILIGEALTRNDAEGHARICQPDAELVNVYGSMEFAYITSWRRRAADPIDFETMPMGSAVCPGDMRLIDEQGAQVPDGATGEIQIVSHNVPYGYLNNPEINRERVGRLDDGRATLLMGDLAYRDFNGVYHSMGRRDQQIKIRGYNVRPPDVEIVIQQQPGIEQAVVVARQTEQGITRLHCYYTGTADPSDLRTGLADKLPAYMTPSLWHRVPSLPKTHSGKVIRGDLPDMSPQTGDLELTTFRTPTERKLAQLFARILETSDFGRDDDFFDLGGDSLQAMRLVIDAEAMFERRIPFEQMILKGASIRTLARSFEGEAGSHLNVLRAGSDTHTLALAHGLGGHLYHYLEVVHALDRTFRVVGVNGKDMHSGYGQSHMADMARHSVDELSPELATGRPCTLVGYSFGAPVAMEMAREMAARTDGSPRLVLLDPKASWRDRRRWLRPIWQAFQDRDVGEAARLAVRHVSAAAGIRPREVDAAHAIAWLTYRPQPLDRARVLIVSADQSDPRDLDGWTRLFTTPPDHMTAPGDHISMLRGSNAGPLAQIIQRWIVENDDPA